MNRLHIELFYKLLSVYFAKLIVKPVLLQYFTVCASCLKKLKDFYSGGFKFLKNYI